MNGEPEPDDPFARGPGADAAADAGGVAAPEGDGPDRAERDRETRRAIEAVLMAATEPVEAGVLAQLTEVPVAAIEAAVAELADGYEAEGRGFVISRVAGGYRFQTAPDLAPYVERFVLEGQHARLSGAALETLAIVAYKQPISRSQVSAIRGVNVDAVLQTLVKRGYVDEVARDPGPGQAVLYGTTRTFLERLELDSLDDLPPLGDFVPDASIVEVLERGLRVTEDAATDPDGAPVVEVDVVEVDVIEVDVLDVVEVDVIDVEPDAVTEDQALDLADAYGIDGEEAAEAEAAELVVVDEIRIVGDVAIETVEVYEADGAEAGAIDAEGPRAGG